MKIVRSRGKDADAGKIECPEVTSSAFADISIPKNVARVDGSSMHPTDLPVLLEDGRVVAIPRKIFRGRVAFQFGKKKNKLLLMCAWCGKPMGEVESKVEGVSHGMCKECFDQVMASELGREKSK